MNNPFTKVAFILILSFKYALSQTPQLWGTTSTGGKYDNGTIFKINLVGSAYDTVYSFNSIKGRIPNCTLVESGDFLYGTTVFGGKYGNGVIFKISKLTNQYDSLYSFPKKTDSFGGIYAPNGAFPGSTLLLGSDNSLYGVTSKGGNHIAGNIGDGYGVLFKYDLTNNQFTKLFAFDSLKGAYPYHNTLVENGLIYGLTEKGGRDNKGVLFSYNISSSVYNSYNLDNVCISNPVGGLVEIAGQKLVGISKAAGDSCANTYNTFTFDIGSHSFLSSFYAGGNSGIFGIDGGWLSINDDLYGIFKDQSGTPGIIRYSPSLSASTILQVIPYGTNPHGGLIQASSGKLYGTTFDGGLFNKGIIFSYDPVSATFDTLHNFNGLKGANPFADLIEVGVAIGIETSINESNIELFPNPCSEKLYLKGAINQFIKIEMIDLYGRKVLSMNSISQNEPIDVSFLLSGIYFLKIESDNEIIIKKIVKEFIL